MKKSIKNLTTTKIKWVAFLLLAFLLGNEKVVAIHKTGGYIEYTWNSSLGNHGGYNIKVVVYDDGSVAPAPFLNMKIKFPANTLSNLNDEYVYQTITENIFSPQLCPGQAQIEIVKVTYLGSFEIPNPVIFNYHHFEIFVRADVRDDAYNTACYWEATTGVCGYAVIAPILLRATNEGYNHEPNNSPRISNDPVWIAFSNATANQEYNPGITDPDGNTIVADLTSPKYSPYYGNIDDEYNLLYNPGYSSTNPISLIGGNGYGFYGPSIFTYDPTASGEIGPLAIKYTDKDGNNIKGSITLEFQIWTFSDEGIAPYLSGINWGANEISICAGTSSCFNIFATDSDPLDLVSLSTNISDVGILPAGAVLTLYNLSPLSVPQLEICWTPSVADIGDYTFTVTATDDHCPLNGETTSTYTIHVVPNNIQLSIPTPAPFCPGTGGITLTPNITGASGGVTYAWSPAMGLSCSSCANPVASPSVTTTYLLTVGSSPCAQTATVVVTVYPNPQIGLLGPTLMCDPNQTFMAVPVTGTGTYHWTVTGGTPTSAVTTTNTFTPTWGAGFFGTVSVYFVNQYGCVSATVSKSLTYCCANATGAPQYDNASSASIPPVLTGNPIYINGVLDVVDDLNIQGSQVYLGPNAEIKVYPGKTLTIDNSTLQPCTNYMWNGVTVKSFGAFYIGKVKMINASKIISAQVGIKSENAGVIQTEGGSVFLNNHIHIYFLNDPNSTTSSYIKQTSFICNQYLIPPFNSSIQPDIPRTLYAIQIENVGYLKIGDESSLTLQNKFDNFGTGIYSYNCKTLGVVNNKFTNAHLTTPWINNTIGISFSAPTSFINYNCQLIAGLGYGVSPANEFNDISGDCIHVRTQCSATVVGNIFNAATVGVSIPYSQYAIKIFGNSATVNNSTENFLIWNNHINGNSSSLYSWLYGISLFDVNQPTGYSSGWANISNNFIYHCKTGIFRNNALLTYGSKTIVQGNTIEHIQNGIWIMNQNTKFPNQPIIDNNQVFVDEPYVGDRSYGIRVEFCQRVEVTCNTINTNSSSVLGQINTDGIFVASSPLAQICTNVIRECERDLECAYKMPMTNIMFNRFTSGKEGFRLTGSNGIVGNQGVSPTFIITQNPFSIQFVQGLNNFNTWTNFNAGNSNYHAYNNGSQYTSQSVFNTPNVIPDYQFPASLSTNIGVSGLPLTFNSIWPLNAFNYNKCSIENFCGDQPGAPEPPDLDNTWANEIIFDSTIVDLDSSGSVTESEIYFAVLNRYYDKQILYQLRNSDSTFASNDSSMNAFIDSVRNSNIGRIDSIEHLIMLAMKNNQPELLDSARQLRDSINAELIAEQNSRTSLGIYINKFTLDSIYIDSTEYEQLFEIAIQCPSDGGIAVYQSRAMLNYFYPEMDYADWCEKLPGVYPEQRMEGNETEPISSLNIFPNPANNFCTIIFSGLGENSVLNITDVSGRNVQQILLSKSIGSVDLNTENLGAGVYFCSALDNKGTTLIKKIILIK